MIAKRKLSVADFLLMGESWVFAPDERVELLEGQIYTMSPPSPQAKPSFYAEAHPQADDTLLVVEVSRTSLDCLGPTPAPHGLGRYDKTEKLPQYSVAGIAEVWIVDVDAGLLEVYREPVGRTYCQRTFIYPGEPVQPLAFEGEPGGDKTGHHRFALSD